MNEKFDSALDYLQAEFHKRNIYVVSLRMIIDISGRFKQHIEVCERYDKYSSLASLDYIRHDTDRVHFFIENSESRTYEDFDIYSPKLLEILVFVRKLHSKLKPFMFANSISSVSIEMLKELDEHRFKEEFVFSFTPSRLEPITIAYDDLDFNGICKQFFNKLALKGCHVKAR